MKILQFLDDHKTKIAGIILLTVSSLKQNAEVVETLLTDEQFSWFTLIAGVIVTVIGSTNTARQKARGEIK